MICGYVFMTLSCILTLSLAKSKWSRDYLPPPTFDLDQDPKIVGGIEINIEDAPHQVSLQRNGRHICGGSIISEKWILTAAHCTYRSTAKSFMIRLGSTEHAEGGILIPVKKIVQHEKFNNENIDNDFSLLELSENIKLDEKQKIIKLIKQNQETPDGTMCHVTGWGVTQNDSESKEQLREVSVPIFSHKKCSKAYAKFGGVTDNMICAGYAEGKRDACQGDSGGPLVCDNTLVGVVSWGYGCAKPEYPGVYSKIAAARAWIDSHISN